MAIIPESISTAIAKKGLDEGIAAAKPLLQRLCGPAIDELALLLQDHARVYRLKNQLRTLGKVQEMLHKAGGKVHAVPLRTLLPLLEGAALENDESLSDKWAGLLASAASSQGIELSHPGFPRILSEMTPREAKILDKLHLIGGQANWRSFRQDLMEEFGCTIEAIDRDYTNLFRLGVCRIKGGKQDPIEPIIELGPFGRFFLTAAYGPSPLSVANRNLEKEAD